MDKMANEIKTEFEMYVKNLAETICKEIYLEDLKKICNTYKEQLDECKNLYMVHTDKDKEMLESAERSVEQLDKLQGEISSRLSDIDSIMQNFDTGCRTLLEQYSTQVQNVNSDLQDAFISNFTSAVRESKDELAAELERCNRTIKESLSETITPENLEHYIKQIEVSTEKISEGLNLINGGYQEVFDAYREKVSAYEEEERNHFQELMKQYVQHGLQSFSDCVERTLAEQKIMLEEKIPDKETLVTIKNEMADLRKDIQNMQSSYEKKLNCLIKIMEKEEKLQLRQELGRRKDHRLITLLIVVNVVLLYFSTITITLLQPWNVFGMIPTVVLGGALVAIFLLVYIWGRNKKAKDIKSRVAKASQTAESRNEQNERKGIAKIVCFNRTNV